MCSESEFDIKEIRSNAGGERRTKDLKVTLELISAVAAGRLRNRLLLALVGQRRKKKDFSSKDVGLR